MRIPKKEVIEFLIKEILSRKNIYSQKELTEELLKELQKTDKEYRITGKRARKIALSLPEVSIKITTKYGSIPELCPVCGSRLKKIHTLNLKGKKVLSKLVCPKCGYQGKQNKWIPKRYEFHLQSIS
ncbi:MAG: hypothetical protein DRP13_03855 [Candidatus Aenigmatarchaeota archaeon]|nr:MAG: hypothetical protein DRP18_01085 [Candidatus Aenigmarchaeota archaeon]RLJ07451.1 MAG: hypothetical protein DRP13_03855 [Candidatus Aenigmarchaeota archaeon]RLJ08167.1 MAG: hypothetical protein DRP16_01995 [Candidatus Aenigmarchaeota archaeon]